MPDRIQSLSFGGGVQSNAMLVLIALGKLPKPDCVIIADTGYETRSTWEYLDSYGAPLCQKLGIPLMRVNRRQTTLAQKYRLPVIKLTHSEKHSVRIPAFVSGERGDIGKLRTFCSGDWKRNVCRWHLRQRFGKAAKFDEWIEFSTDEYNRAARNQAAMRDGDRWRRKFPLIKLGISRHRAIQIVADFGFPPPPRSSCYMCPNRSNAEWRDIRDNKPDEWEMVQKFEQKLQNDDDKVGYVVWLHRSGKPIGQAPIDDDTAQADFGFCDSGACFT